MVRLKQSAQSWLPAALVAAFLFLPTSLGDPPAGYCVGSLGQWVLCEGTPTPTPTGPAATPTPAAGVGSCTDPVTGMCWHVPGILGASCSGQFVPGGVCPPPATPTPTSTPTPTPLPGREGEITWKPGLDGQAANYVEGPWGLSDAGHLYVGGHAGYCCFSPPPDGPGFEGPFIVDFGPTEVQAHFPVTDLIGRLDTHEHAFGSVVFDAEAGRWVLSIVRTTWSTQGKDNRARTCVFTSPTLTATPWPDDRVDVLGPKDPACQPRGSCPGGGYGSMMPVLVYGPERLCGALLVYVGDGVGVYAGGSGEMVYKVKVETDPVRTSFTFIGEVSFGPSHSEAISDITIGDDGLMYALVSSGTSGCWWSTCSTVRELVSQDGLNFMPGKRTWTAPPGLLLWDAGYVRDPRGGIKRDAVMVIGLVSETADPTSGKWRLHWWADPGVVLPATWGKSPDTAVRLVVNKR